MNSNKLEELTDKFQNLSLQKKYGQYFTTNNTLLEILYEFIKNKPQLILEPSVGRGDIVEFINKKIDVDFDMYEIDDSIIPLKSIDKEIIYTDFLSHKIENKYVTIIGNPPYVKTKSGNLYLKFIHKCFHLLDDNGELIFIIPSDFFKITSSKDIINEMIKNGNFTHIYHPHDEKLFKNANIDVIIFRYHKTKKITNKCLYNKQTKFITNSNGILTFNDNNIDDKYILSDYFNIYVGIVSGKDNVYKNEELGNITVLINENKEEKFIKIDKFPSNNSEIDSYLLSHKKELIERKIRNFNDKNWFEWGALRNIKTIEENIDKPCIYVKNLTRNSNIAFIDKVKLFGGSLLIMIPKNNDIDLEIIKNYLNSDKFKKNFTYSNRFKIGQRQLLNCKFPHII